MFVYILKNVATLNCGNFGRFLFRTKVSREINISESVLFYADIVFNFNNSNNNIEIKRT